MPPARCGSNATANSSAPGAPPAQINRRLRRALEHRDPSCAVPGCGATRGLHAHHIRHWEDGGPTELANLVLVCPYHHRLHHRGVITITGPADHLTVTDSDGPSTDRRITGPPTQPPPPAVPPCPGPTGERAGVALAASTLRPRHRRQTTRTCRHNDRRARALRRVSTMADRKSWWRSEGRHNPSYSISRATDLSGSMCVTGWPELAGSWRNQVGIPPSRVSTSTARSIARIRRQLVYHPAEVRAGTRSRNSAGDIAATSPPPSSPMTLSDRRWTADDAPPRSRHHPQTGVVEFANTAITRPADHGTFNGPPARACPCPGYAVPLIARLRSGPRGLVLRDDPPPSSVRLNPRPVRARTRRAHVETRTIRRA